MLAIQINTAIGSIFFVLAFALTLSGPSYADEVWQFRGKTRSGLDCFAFRNWPDGRAMQIRVRVSDRRLSFFWTYPLLRDAKKAETRAVSAKVDTHSPWSIRATSTGLLAGGTLGKTYLSFSTLRFSDQFLDQFSKGFFIEFIDEFGTRVKFDLAGTLRVTRVLRACSLE